MTLTAAYSTISAASIAAVVAQRYAIGTPARCRLFLRGFNDTYELEGADGRRYMARLCDHRFRGPANVDYETALLAHLSGSGIVVGAPVPDRDGRLWRLEDAPEGPRELAVFVRLEGRAPLGSWQRTGKADERTLADLHAMGASLASIHLAAETYDGPASLFRLEGPHLLENPLAQIHAATDGELAQEIGEVGARLGTRLGECAALLCVGHCHGDNHAGNTLITDTADGATAPGWFDFDDGGPGFLAYDLATFLWTLLLRRRSNQLDETTAPLWPAFINGYRSVRPIPSADFDAVGLFVAIRQINLMGQYASRIPQWGAGFVSDDWLRSGLDLVRKFEALATPAAD